MWRARALALPALMVLVVACGGPAASQSSAGSETSNDPGTSAAASTGGEASAEASTGGGGGGDYGAVAESLIPPNSTEVTKTTPPGYSFIIYDSTDSVEALTSYYESAIPAAGMTIFSTTNNGGQVAWVFADSEGSTFGGSVSLYPSGTPNHTAVSVAVGSEP